MIQFNRIPIHTAEAAKNGQNVPYLDIDGEDEPIEFLFTLGGKYGLIARANLHVLKGAPKAGKSAAGLALLAAALKGEFIGLKANQDSTRVLWIDTEQDKNTLRQKARAVLSMAELDAQPEALKVVALRGCGGPADALDITLQAIADNAPDFVFLDGVVDLCPAFNDEEQSREAVRKLEASAEQYGAAILGLIHTNKYNEEARGHLGAIMQQKSAEIYLVNKVGDEASVTQPFSRFAPVPSWGFVFADDFKISSAADAHQQAANRAQWQMKGTFKTLFDGEEKMTKAQLIKVYTEYYDCKRSKAEKDIKAAFDNFILNKTKEGRQVYYTYISPLDLDYDDEDL